MLTKRDKRILRWMENFKALSIKQCSSIFFNNNYEGCRRRLKQLEKMELLKSYRSKLLGKIYYKERRLKDHELLIYEFIKEIIVLGANIRKIKIQPQYLNGLIRPDAYVEFVYKENVYFIFLEVDYTHNTDKNKLDLYECLYRRGELQDKCYGTFPLLLVARPVVAAREYESNYLDVVFTDLEFGNVKELLAGEEN